MNTELARSNEDNSIIAFAKAEIQVLMEQASYYRRETKTFMNEAISLATHSEEIAASCIFSLPRRMKNKQTGKYEQGYIKGKSIRLAEIIFSVYKNIKVDVRISNIGTKTVTAIASCIDLQNRTFLSEEAMVNINGDHADAVKLAVGSAKSIAIRNAIFRLVPGALSDEIYKRAVECAVGNQRTFPERRKEVFERISKLGIPQQNIFSFYNKTCIEDFDAENIEEIIGVGTAIKEGHISIDKAFTSEGDSESKSVGDTIDELKKEREQKTTAVDTKTEEPKTEYDKVKKQIENAKSMDTLAIAADLITSIPDGEGDKDALANLYLKRKAEFDN